MQKHRKLLSKVSAVFTAAALSTSVLVPTVLSGVASAGQVTSRAIKMNNSQTSATGVQYELSFTTVTAAQSLVLDFCSGSDTPIIGGACTAPAGFSLASVSVGSSGMGAWTPTLAASTLKLAGGASIGAGAQTITISNVTNPSTNGTFYARVTTYADATFGSSTVAYTAPATPGDYKDFGGFALSTNDVINISAKVQEQLVFCVSKAAPGSGCSGTSAPNLALGHGANTILDSTAVDTDTAYFQVSTNASGNVIVRMKGTVLTSGSNTIPASPAGTNTPFSISAGTADFGMQVTTAGTNATPDSNYDGTVTTTNYGFDVTTATNNATSGYGDPIATVSAVQNSNTLLKFAATASLVTPAGLYTATQNLIATGTY